MKLRDFALLADENIDREVVKFLESSGFDVLHVRDSNLIGSSDLELIRSAYAQRRIVLTHDRDFGKLAVSDLEPLIGIVFLRPGHIDPQFTVDTLQALLGQDLELTPPFILVAEREGGWVRFRMRQI